MSLSRFENYKALGKFHLAFSSCGLRGRGGGGFEVVEDELGGSHTQQTQLCYQSTCKVRGMEGKIKHGGNMLPALEAVIDFRSKFVL